MINLQEIGKKIACSGEWREKKREGDDVIGFQAARAGFIRADIRRRFFHRAANTTPRIRTGLLEIISAIPRIRCPFSFHVNAIRLYVPDLPRRRDATLRGPRGG